MSSADSTTGPCRNPSLLLPLLETLEDPAASPGVLTDALLTLTNRLTGEEGKEFAAEVGKYFSQLCKIFKTHIPTENSELSSAALQALGFCVFNPRTASLLCEGEIQELISIVNSVAMKSGDKNTRTRALWVLSKQSFPSDIVGKLVPSIIATLETVLNKGDLHSMVVEYEALNVIIRLIEQAPSHMEEQAVRWAKLIIPLVVHSAHKVQLRSATALEMGVPLLLQKQQEVAAVTEELMTTKIISELQKLFSSKNETYVLKLWPLFVKLLGKALHRSGSFINSLLQLEELGFRSGSPVVKKIAFIAWKSLIDNFALNPEILCSAKRLKLLMQPLSSIHVRTEALALTKLEVWWYLLLRLGPQLPAHFEQVCVPLIQSTLSLDASTQGNSSRVATNQSLMMPGSSQKSGAFPFGSPATRMSLGSCAGGILAIPSIQLLGIEMLLHFFMGPEVLTFAKENKIVLSLEPLQHSVITSPSFFCKHASTFINTVQDGFIAIGKDASDIILNAIWKEMIGFVRAAIESGSKRERQSSEVLTMMLKALKNIVASNELSVLKSLSLIEITIKELPAKVLGSPAYQIANMDLLNGTPALFLIQLSFWEDLLKSSCVQDERFFLNYESLVGFVLSGPTSPLAFSESVFTVVSQNAKYLENKEHLWRLWSIVVNPLTEWINQTNEVNQGDALEHNFSAVYSALLLPVNHIFTASALPPPTMKTLLRSWSDLYRAFARCASLVATAEDNLCCEELCAKITSGLEGETHMNLLMLDALSHIVSVMIDCINFAPYGAKYQPINKSPQIASDRSKKKRDPPLGKLSSLIKLLVMLTNSLCMLWSKESNLEKLTAVGASVLSGAQNIIGHISLASVIRSLFETIINPLAVLYEKAKSADASRMNNGLCSKFEKLLVESINCLQSHYTGSFDNELLQEVSPFLCLMFLSKNKQIRSQVAQFWNATFGKAVMLTYPETLKSVLSEVKQKILLSLPGFESIDIVGVSNGTDFDSTENSQWDTKISGIEVKANGKRNSLMVQTKELEGKTNSHVTPVKMKLEFPLSKTNRKEMLLEEENTLDFVFIPPETKERVLTEHQKEVFRTKRVDIPTMYNNLDASQDATLFCQYTQSQEDSVEKPTLTMKEEDGKEENKIISQDEKVTGDLVGAPPKVTENCKSDLLLEKTQLASTGQLHTLGEESPDSSCEDSEMCASKTAPGEMSVLDKSLNESTSNVSSSSSASSDIISGTPQPVSRRQSFITLEKFDNSENRPFSPSTFNNVLGTSGSISLLAKQESMIASDTSFREKSNVVDNSAPIPKMDTVVTRTKRPCLESTDALETHSEVKKAKDDKANSKLRSESTPGVKRSGLRQSKTELSEDKKPKLIHSDQEEPMQVSPGKLVEAGHKLLGETQEAKGLLDIPPQASDLNVIGSTENKQILDNVSDTKAGSNLDSKENTPPEAAVSGDAIPNVGQTSPNQKILRRSLRRKSETTEGLTDSQDKENSQQKKDRHKDAEKLLPRKVSQGKEDAPQKQKSFSEKTIVTQSVNKKDSTVHGNNTDCIGSKKSHASRSLQEETSTSTKKSEGSCVSDTDDVQDLGPDTTVEKSKGFPRYHTRRSTQGLLSSIENSESDSSETKEEGTKRKKLGRWKNKCNSLESQVKEELESQNQKLLSQEKLEFTTEIQATSVENKDAIHSEGCMEIALTGNSEKGENSPILSDCSGLEGVVSPQCRDNLDAEKTAAKMVTKPTLEPVLKTRQSTKMLDNDSVLHSDTNCPAETLSIDGYTTALSTFSSFEKSSETSECLHKRSKRTRKSKSCDCCGEKSSVQLEKLPTELKKVDSSEPKLKEPKKILSKSTETSSCIPVAEDSRSAETLNTDPSATSTPVLSAREFVDLKDSSTGTESEEGLPGNDDQKDEHTKLLCVKSANCQLSSEMPSCVQLARVTSGLDSDPKESIIQNLPSEVNTEPAAIKKDVDCFDEVEESPNAETCGEQLEEATAREPVADMVESDMKATVVPSVAEIPEPQEELGEEESTEMDVAAMPVAPGTPTLVKDDGKGSCNVDSPLKLKELDTLSLAKMSESPNGVQARCIWSPAASPSTSILKRGIKRPQEEESPSPANKSRRVSFANPIYQEELADDIDRRSPVVRPHPSNGSPSPRSIKPLSNNQAKLITTPTKGSLSPGSRSHKYKSSKKCLITEMVKEPLPAPTESIYPALVGCKAPVDTILPQITSNIWARGLGQLIRAKNIRTVGDLSSLSAAEIKTLPIRSPKVSNVKRVLKGYHDQQVKSRSFEETAGLDDTEKSVNGIDEKPSSTNEVSSDLSEPVSSNADEQSATDLSAQINILAAQIHSENLHRYSGSELFEMQEKLHSITHCIMKNLQSRWQTPPRESMV
ncbi:telomere-associated protein RIF1 isoform X2 [Hemicordylus capensis]|uniref:telomere-associated protein RIF1 isoform X2 n=1 Tax=Hemicordylus capensis TaxID=884348 RepID=UPI0023040393|nr:telomere-associated protein RIF1 isoform X2 [Hemicordylus capensis]